MHAQSPAAATRVLGGGHDPSGAVSRVFQPAGGELSLGRRTNVESPGGRFVRRFRQHHLAVLGLLFLSVMMMVAAAAPVIAPRHPDLPNLAHFRQPPSRDYLLGTDDFGRDVLSRLIYGSRISLSVGFVAVAITEVIAVILGCLAGYYRGRVDQVIMRLADVVLCFPWLIIVLTFIAFLGPSIFNIMLAIGLLAWPGPTRIVRAQVLSMRETLYVTAARASGASDRRIMFLHILPGIVGPLTVHTTFGIALAILTEAALSFLGIGVQLPQASWGNMLSDALSLTTLTQMPWLWVPPGLAIFLTVLTINFVGDGLRDALDPRDEGSRRLPEHQ
jgi:peptide/nickel transport system permease protein